jgi:large subunit ribosomal protein L17
MKKNVFGRQFKRDANERKALFKNLLTSLVLHDRIRTTEEKAKAIKSNADKLITKAKKGGASAFQNLEPQVSHEAVIKLVNDLALRFSKRQGGYTRLIKMGHRGGDNASMAILEWSEPAAPVVIQPKASVSSKKDQKKIAKKETKTEEKKTVKKSEAKKEEKK